MFGFGKKRKIVGHKPSKPVIGEFTPVKDFYSKRMRSHYVKDQTYSIRQGNIKLETQLLLWQEKGLVVMAE